MVIKNEKRGSIRASNVRRKSRKNRKRNKISLAVAEHISLSQCDCNIRTPDYATYCWFVILSIVFSMVVMKGSIISFLTL